jgi:hypothetical protein
MCAVCTVSVSVICGHFAFVMGTTTGDRGLPLFVDICGLPAKGGAGLLPDGNGVAVEHGPGSVPGDRHRFVRGRPRVHEVRTAVWRVL